jgi:hypothetical protein
LSWTHATLSNAVGPLEEYLHQHPKGHHVAAAIGRLEDCPWDQARQKDTVASYGRYCQDYPRGHFVAKAQSRQAVLLKDDTPFLKAQAHGTKEAYATFLEEFPGHKQEAAARAAAEDLRGRDVMDLLQEGKVEIKAQGSGMESVELTIRRRVSHSINVRVPVGTFFISRNASAQDMVVCRESEVALTTDEWVSTSVSAACADSSKDIPGRNDAFEVRRSPHRAELARLMSVLDKAQASTDIRQAAIWIVTNNADYADLGTLVESQIIGIGGTRAIREAEAAAAMKFCEDAGIDIRERGIWKDREAILKGLKDERLRTWLEQRQ